jgi:hypothetical protein
VATHLAAGSPGLTPDRLVDPVVGAIRRVALGGETLSRLEQVELARLDWLRGRALAAPAPGIADGIAEDGALRVRRSDGTMTLLRAGTVVLADTPAVADLRSCS